MICQLEVASSLFIQSNSVKEKSFYQVDTRFNAGTYEKSNIKLATKFNLQKVVLQKESFSYVVWHKIDYP